MKPGQTRVLVLLIVLFALEMVVKPGIKDFFHGAINQWNTALYTASQKGKQS